MFISEQMTAMTRSKCCCANIVQFSEYLYVHRILYNYAQRILCSVLCFNHAVLQTNKASSTMSNVSDNLNKPTANEPLKSSQLTHKQQSL